MYKQKIPDMGFLRKKKRRPIQTVVKEVNSCHNCLKRPNRGHEQECILTDVTGKCLYWRKDNETD